jgi:hypothetical protein
MIEPNGVVWALSALFLFVINALGVFLVFGLIFALVAWPLMFFAKAVIRVILGYKL